jgi:predicted transcriptional regulator
MNKEKKEYLSLYLLQNEKIRRLKETAFKNPEEKEKYISQIKAAQTLRREIEDKIEAVDGGVLSELLYLKYVCGKTLMQISYELNYSVRQIERLHIKALQKFKM